MRHKAPRPFVDWWFRLPRTTARLLGHAARHGPFQVLAALMVTLGLGAGAYVAVSTVSAGSSNTATASADSTAPDGELPHASDGTPASDGGTASGDSSDPEEIATGRPGESSPTTRATSDLSPTRSLREGASTGTPSTSPSQASAATAAEDVTAPNTSLSEEYPEPDAAEFSFTANEPASFTCSLDGAAYTPCDSPTLYSDLDPGWHTFAVRATDAAGNTDPSPAETRWLARKGGS